MLKILRISLFLCFVCPVVSAQVNLSSGLVAYYPFNGSFNDASGSGNHGTAMNGVSFGADQWGNANNAAFFDGINDWISIAASPSMTPGRQFAMAFRFKTASSGIQVLFSKSNYSGSSAPNNFQYQVGINAGSSLPSNALFFATNHNNSCVITGPTASNYAYGTNTNNNQWYCVVLTFDNGVKKVYMNGVLISTVTISSTSNNSSIDSCTGGTFRIGTWWQNDLLYFKGLMDEVRLYNRSLNTQEIDSLCHLTTAAPTQSIINRYAAVTGANNACNNTYNVDDATGFAAGDTVLMIQMKGAVIDSSNSSSFGTILNYNGAGNYEFNVVSSVSGNAVTLRYKLSRNYDIPDGKVQLVRVPYFQNYAVNQPLTALPWNGSKGGIVVLNASGTVTLNAPIDVSSKGFRSGTTVSVAINAAPCGEKDYYYSNATNSYGAEKGEGIAQLSSARSNGRGPQGNGGGGGNSHNTGGAGGSNGGAGGTGGKETGIATCAPAQPVGGIGGIGLTYSNSLNKVFLGGGGGAGHVNNNEGATGYPGGGIVMVMANQLLSNRNAIMANGGDAAGCVGDCWDGQPGGAAGGTVLLHVNSYADTTLIHLRGGSGGSQAANNSVSGTTGPGGGGGGGALWVKGTSIPAQVTATLNGGAKGVFLNTNDPWGTTDGQTGISLSGLSIPFPTDTFRTPVLSLGKDTLLCPGDTIRLNAGNAGSAYLYSTGATTQTAPVITGGSYSVVLTTPYKCVLRDTIVISNGVNPVVRLGNDTAICPGATITLNGGISGSGFAYQYSNNATTATTNATNAGTYSLRVTNLTTGCRGRDTIVISQGQNPIVNLGRDTAICPGKSMTLDAGNPGSTYLYSTSATTRLINVTAAGTYSVRVTNATKCVGRDTVVIAQGVDPVVDLGNDTSVCADSAVTVDAGNPGSTYLYSTGATTRTHSLIPAGTYTVQVTNPQGCIGRDTITVSVFPKPIVSAITPVRSGASLSFGSNAQHAGTYHWSFGDNTTSNLDSPSHTYTANGNYSVRLIVSNSCGSDTMTTSVAIEGLSAGTGSKSNDLLLIYPNPASASITVDNRSTMRLQSVTMLNSLGAVVIRKEGTLQRQETLDVRSLPAGIYMVRLQTDGGSWLYKIQILK